NGGGRPGLLAHAFGRLDLGGQDIPIVVAERLRDQLKGLAVAGFDRPVLQGVTQGVRHGLRIAKIAHESTSSSANGGNRGLPCRPVRQWRGREKLIRSPSQKGAGGGCIDPTGNLGFRAQLSTEQRNAPASACP